MVCSVIRFSCLITSYWTIESESPSSLSHQIETAFIKYISTVPITTLVTYSLFLCVLSSTFLQKMQYSGNRHAEFVSFVRLIAIRHNPFSKLKNLTWKFSIKDFFSKCDQIRRYLRIWSHLLKKSLMENFIFCAVLVTSRCLSVFFNYTLRIMNKALS